MQYATLALALAASAVAAPTASPAKIVPLVAPLTCEQFSVSFMVDGQLQSANAAFNGTNGPMVLQAERLSVYPGTPAYFNSSDPTPNAFHYKALNFVTKDGVYGASAPNIGDAQGVADNVVLTKNAQQFEWLVNGGNITHELFAAPNGFYACKDKLIGSDLDNFFLRFGDYNYTATPSPPANCNVTRVFQNFNVPGGLTQ